MSFLQRVPHPNGSGDDIVYAGAVLSLTESDGEVRVVLHLDPHYRDVKRLVQQQLQPLRWITALTVAMDSPSTETTTRNPSSPASPPSPSPRSASAPPSSSSSPSSSPRSSALPPNLRGIRHIVAVSSCKGGVGKSTIALNLAYALSLLPLRVGLFDADVFGPSLPTLVANGQWAEAGLFPVPGTSHIRPYTYRGVATMSYGYAAPSTPSTPISSSPSSPPSSSANVLRGPLAASLTRDLLTRTAWGELDVLLLDCPPGTSDVLLTLTQLLPLSGAVVVTTPQRLAYVDVVRGLDMFRRVHVPVVALVENMSGYQCEGCGKEHRVFGAGHMAEMRTEVERGRGVGAPPLMEYRLPLVAEVSEWSDRGEPFVLRTEGGKQAQAVRDTYRRMAEELRGWMEGEEAKEEGVEKVRVRWEEGVEGEEGLVVMEEAGQRLYVEGPLLRGACRCAGCVDEATGRRRAEGRGRKGVRAVGLQAKGNYGVAVAWSDGHASSIYTHRHIAELGRPSKEAAHLFAREEAQRSSPVQPRS